MYLHIIQNSINYIEDNIKADISLRELAEMAGFSQFYYAKIFQKELGMTINQYILHRKMLNAICDIHRGGKIIDVALEYGFETHAGFYKAFVREFGETPTQYLKNSQIREPYKVNILKKENIEECVRKFSDIVKVYEEGRPSYSMDFIKFLYEEQGVSSSSSIGEFGSGTGKFTKQLLERGSKVYGIEPNQNMQEEAKNNLHAFENFIPINGSAEFSGLGENSVDFITVAQAFHWFSVNDFKKECEKILKDKGKVYLIWNLRDMSEFVNQKSYDIYKKYCPNFKGFGGGIQKHDTRIRQFFDNKYMYKEFSHPLFYDKDTFISRSLSGTYSLKIGDQNYQRYIDELTQLFDEYSVDGVFMMPNKTVVYYGKI